MEAVDTRTCTRCGEEKPVAELVPSKRYTGGFMPLCKPCRNEYWRTRRATNPEARAKHRDAVKRSQWLTGYGLTSADYNRMLAEQDGKCALCKSPEHGRTERFKYWNVDHCHKTGKVRALLCHVCNITLGKFENLEDKVGREKILAYIDQTKGGGVNAQDVRPPQRPAEADPR